MSGRGAWRRLGALVHGNLGALGLGWPLGLWGLSLLATLGPSLLAAGAGGPTARALAVGAGLHQAALQVAGWGDVLAPLGVLMLAAPGRRGGLGAVWARPVRAWEVLLAQPLAVLVLLGVGQLACLVAGTAAGWLGRGALGWEAWASVGVAAPVAARRAAVAAALAAMAGPRRALPAGLALWSLPAVAALMAAAEGPGWRWAGRVLRLVTPLAADEVAPSLAAWVALDQLGYAAVVLGLASLWVERQDVPLADF